MGSTEVRQQGTRPPRAAFDLVITKLQRPPLRPGTVQRRPLMDRLRRNDSGPIVSVVAPAGYGKTTLLSQWAERNGQAFAWCRWKNRITIRRSSSPMLPRPSMA
jgi:ATP/maltotriose-dependent transcriptional regulator MalT